VAVASTNPRDSYPFSFAGGSDGGDLDDGSDLDPDRQRPDIGKTGSGSGQVAATLGVVMAPTEKGEVEATVENEANEAVERLEEYLGRGRRLQPLWNVD